MKLSLQQLQKIMTFPHLLSLELDLKKYLKGSQEGVCDTEIIDVLKTNVEIQIYKIDYVTFRFVYHIITTVVVPCALTLEEVNYPMDFEVEETYSDNIDDDNDYYPFENNSIDIDSIVWSNIVINVPIRVVRDDAYEILESRNIKLNEMPNDEE